MEKRIKLFTVGIVLILAGWGVKHLLVSLAVFSGGSALKEASVQADRNADIARATVDNEVAMAEERLKDRPDPERLRELDRANDDVRDRIRREYLIEETEAEADSAAGGATALSLVQWFLWLKPLLDVVKVAGVILVVLATLGLVVDEGAPSPLRWFSVAVSTVALAAILVGGVLSWLS